MCRSRRELSNEYLLAKIGVDTAENEPLEVLGENSIQYSLHSLIRPNAAAADQKRLGLEVFLPPRPIVVLYLDLLQVAQVMASWFKKSRWLLGDVGVYCRSNKGREGEHKTEENNTVA